jgi:HAD superfamily hydrolase (TIGR01509 family)
MKNTLDVSAVIFDMDGVMFDTERIAVQTWRRVGEVIGYNIPETIIIESIGCDASNTQKLFEERLGENFPFSRARELRLQYAAEVITQHGVPVKEGLFELLEVLEAHSLLKAVATSTERSRAEFLLRSSHLIDRFDALVFGDEVLHGKPEPDIFVLAAERLGFSAEKCVVLEDSELGIRAAHAAKMIPIFIPDLKPLPKDVEALTNKIFPSLFDVATFLFV